MKSFVFLFLSILFFVSCKKEKTDLASFKIQGKLSKERELSQQNRNYVHYFHYNEDSTLNYQEDRLRDHAPSFRWEHKYFEKKLSRIDHFSFTERGLAKYIQSEFKYHNKRLTELLMYLVQNNNDSRGKEFMTPWSKYWRSLQIIKSCLYSTGIRCSSLNVY